MKQRSLFLLAVIVLGLNLRPVLAGVGPLLDRIQADTGLDHVGASLLTTLPVIAMGLGALISSSLRRLLGERLGILLGCMLVALACAWRGMQAHALPLVSSALLAGAGIAFVQALLPGMIKQRFASDSDRMIGFYSCSIMAGAAFAAAGTPWLGSHLGWSMALAAWGLPALLACLLWWTASAQSTAPAVSIEPEHLSLLRSPRAWLLMSFFGIGTAGYTLVLAWLPPFYTALGWTAQQSGVLLAGVTLCEVSAGLLISSQIARWPDRRLPLFAVLVSLLLGLLGLLSAPHVLWLPICILLGCGIGALFPLSLIVAQDHLDDPRQTGELLAFVQGGGYLVAACAPLLAGLLREYTHDLRLSWLLMAVATLLLMILASRFAPDSGHFHRQQETPGTETD
ncbi:MFS transporter [Pseudomonas sp. LRF_L74]|uniref:MFS transporter n=1 Tax=Pseudomonas sp. LRF_L74 TaxID=3369422 RepID=UPI003F6122F1